MLQVPIPLYLGDLGIERVAGWESFALIIPTMSSVLCLRRKYQLELGVLVPGQRTVNATVSQTIACYLVFTQSLKVYLNKK